MAPTRFNSVRQKSSSAVRVAAFRDDTSLIALSYDKAVAADPPVPIPARNPMRSARPRSERPASSRPIIISPPLAPPTEQHPAFRTSFNPSADERKRDSGLAPTSPTSTLREEGDDYLAQFKVDDTLKSGIYKSEALHVEAAKQTSKLEQAGGDTTWANDRPAAARGQGAVTTQSIPEEEPVSCPSSPSSSTSLARSSTLAGNSSPSRSFIRRSFSLRSLTASSRRGEGLTIGEELPSMASRQASSSKTPAGARATTATAGSLASVPPEGSSTGPLEGAHQQPRIRGFEASPTAEPQAPKEQDQHQPPRPSTPTSPKTSPAARFWLRASRLPRRSPSISTDPDDGTDPDTTFSPLTLTTNIPTDSLLEDDFLTGLSFSQRGSIMLGGQRAFSFDGPMDPANDGADRDARPCDNDAPVPTTPAGPVESTMTSSSAQAAPAGTASKTDVAHDNATPAATSLLTPDIRVMAADVQRESEKVRSLYAAGDALNWEDGAPSHTFNDYLEPTIEASGEDEEDHDARSRRRLTPGQSTSRSGSVSSQQREAARKETELAGGLEDWEDIDGANIDRYGFIEPPRIASRPSSRMGTPTSLKSSQFSPRKRNVLQKRDAADFASPLGGARAPSRKVSRRSLNTQHSGMSTTSVRSQRSVMRQAGNLLPHNRGRRWMDEAGDMLTTSPSVHDLAEEAKMDKISEALKRKEWERSEKWRKMAKNVKKGAQGEGMEFEFDIQNPKLIERTWKGIPDRWRGAAWWSFLAEHAKADDKSPSDDSIIADFHRLQKRASPDDVQIDLDVPRTINRHIMFRRRYRGGQRLMFRVLHALSLYFPDTGYVQGMASLAATLLCYFDEEKCFVMLVRMWQLRGLEYLYRPGFEGLLAALKDFDSNWLHKDVADKLSELCIDNTAYGTRWYLTLFNLSIPFAAQLRVWDVFLLMGSVSGASGPSRTTNGATDTPGGLDVLHATSAALIQALREVLLDSDFENAMKALTSWIPIKDEDMLMKVTKAEWKAHQGKRRG